MEKIIFLFMDSTSPVETTAEREDDYEGSTDEESEPLTQPSVALGKTKYIVFVDLSQVG